MKLMLLSILLPCTMVNGGLLDAILHGAELNGYGERLLHYREHVAFHQHHDPPPHVPAYVPPPPPQPPAPIHDGYDYPYY